jgi:hypothetical protein
MINPASSKYALPGATAALASCVVLAAASGCGRKEAGAQAGRLAESFASADAGVQAELRDAEAAVQATNYQAALDGLNRVAARQSLTPEQKAAMLGVLGQVTKAASANPALDSQALYESRRQLMEKLYGQ